MMESTETQILYNIDSSNQAVNKLDDGTPRQYSEDEKRRLFNDQDDGPKVAAIAKKIKELTQNATDA